VGFLAGEATQGELQREFYDVQYSHPEACVITLLLVDRSNGETATWHVHVGKSFMSETDSTNHAHKLHAL